MGTRHMFPGWIVVVVYSKPIGVRSYEHGVLAGARPGRRGFENNLRSGGSGDRRRQRLAAHDQRDVMDQALDFVGTAVLASQLAQLGKQTGVAGDMHVLGQFLRHVDLTVAPRHWPCG